MRRRRRRISTARTHKGVGFVGGSVVHFPCGKLPIGPARQLTRQPAQPASKECRFRTDRRLTRSVIMGADSSIDITIDIDQTSLAGSLTMPDEARGLVIFAHGSGSGRHSPRNRDVASLLNTA